MTLNIEFYFFRPPGTSLVWEWDGMEGLSQSFPYSFISRETTGERQVNTLN